jgi:hypothetical protein
MDSLLYITIIGKQQPFTTIPELLLLQIFEYLNSGPFIISYNKNTKLLDITINKHFPIIIKTLEYKQKHPPYYHNLLIGNKRRIIVSVDPYGKGLVKDLIWYGNNNKIIFHQTDTDSRRRALITRWKNKEIKTQKKKQLIQLTKLSTKNHINYPLISINEYIKNTSFKKPILSRSCIQK